MSSSAKIAFAPRGSELAFGTPSVTSAPTTFWYQFVALIPERPIAPGSYASTSGSDAKTTSQLATVAVGGSRCCGITRKSAETKRSYGWSGSVSALAAAVEPS